MVQDAELGKRFVDKLAKVALRDGSERWVYVHLEVQGSAQAEFAERMFVYHYRLFDRYRQPVASLAVRRHHRQLAANQWLAIGRWAVRLS